jgi:hypothetical protein
MNRNGAQRACQLRPRCIRAARPRTQMQTNQSTNQSINQSEWACNFMPQLLYPQWKRHLYQMEQKIRRAPELVCRNFSEEINLLILLGITLRFLCLPAHGLVTILTMLSGSGKGLKLTFVPYKVAASTVLHRSAWGMSSWSLSQQMNTVPNDDLKP